ncbi:hypothetical protein V529_40490 [Bacillus velezensis SQR9]|nr:hypothetical protein V529_40490 [Bacillus velezensis SQR9]
MNNISFEVNHDTLEHLLACFFICENEKPVKKQKTYNNRNKNEKNNLINRHFVSFYILTLSRNVQSAV